MRWLLVFSLICATVSRLGRGAAWTNVATGVCGVIKWPWSLEAEEATGDIVPRRLARPELSAQSSGRSDGALIPWKAPSELADVLHTDQRRCELSHGEALSSVLTDDEHSQRCVLGSAVCETRL